MWNAGHKYNQEELEVIKELERELFKYDPGFRAMWHDDFEAFFQGTLDEELWERRERERNKELEKIHRKRLIEDFEYVKFQHQRSVLEEQIFGNANFSIKYNEWQKDFHQRHERWENDKLYQTAKSWGWQFSKAALELYEQNKNIDLFRIGINASYVPAKIVFGSDDDKFEESIENFSDLAWNTSWIGYTLALIFLNRSLESLMKFGMGNLNLPLNIDSYLKIGLDIRAELMDRLEKLHETALKTAK